MSTVTYEDVVSAAQTMNGAMQTPCDQSIGLSRRFEAEIFLKKENMQRTGSFKDRGAFIKLRELSQEDCQRGVVAASAGNHAQGVAFHAQALGIHAKIVMPINTPLVKVTRTREFGAEVILHGTSFDDAFAEARRVEAAEQRIFIHAFDDPAIVAGQGTVGLEILDCLKDVDIVVAAAGGGGLVGGIGLVVKERLPNAKIIAVESDLVPSLSAALRASVPVEVPPSATLADGIAVRRVGALPLSLAQQYVDQVIRVSESEIAESILWLLEREKSVAEGAGAAPLAAILSGKIDVKGKRVAVVVGGGNIDVNVVSRIIERGLRKSGRVLRVRVWMEDVPGSLARVLQAVSAKQANVIEVAHDRIGERTGLGETEIALTLETRGDAHVRELLGEIAAIASRLERF